jgi:hypothetical protein
LVQEKYRGEKTCDKRQQQLNNNNNNNNNNMKFPIYMDKNSRGKRQTKSKQEKTMAKNTKGK